MHNNLPSKLLIANVFGLGVIEKLVVGMTGYAALRSADSDLVPDAPDNFATIFALSGALTVLNYAITITSLFLIVFFNFMCSQGVNARRRLNQETSFSTGLGIASIYCFFSSSIVIMLATYIARHPKASDDRGDTLSASYVKDINRLSPLGITGSLPILAYFVGLGIYGALPALIAIIKHATSSTERDERQRRHGMREPSHFNHHDVFRSLKVTPQTELVENTLPASLEEKQAKIIEILKQAANQFEQTAEGTDEKELLGAALQTSSITLEIITDPRIDLGQLDGVGRAFYEAMLAQKGELPSNLPAGNYFSISRFQAGDLENCLTQSNQTQVFSPGGDHKTLLSKNNIAFDYAYLTWSVMKAADQSAFMTLSTETQKESFLKTLLNMYHLPKEAVSYIGEIAITCTAFIANYLEFLQHSEKSDAIEGTITVATSSPIPRAAFFAEEEKEIVSNMGEHAPYGNEGPEEREPQYASR